MGIVRGPNKRGSDQLRQGFGKSALTDQPELGQHMVEPAGGFSRDTTRAVQRTPVDRSAVDERATKPGEHLGGVLGHRRNNGLEAHDGSLFRPSNMNSTILFAVAVAIPFGSAISIP